MIGPLTVAALACFLLPVASRTPSATLMTQRGTNKPRPPQTTGFAQIPFDTSVERLPANFKGHDAKRIITILEEKREKTKKGEFETTADYERRLQQHDPSLYAGLREDSTLAFVADMDESSEYDADAKMLTFWVSTMLDDKIRIVRLADDAKERTYTATNSFGAKTGVTELRGDRYGISLKNVGTQPGGHVPMDVPTAKAIKARAKTLVVCRPSGDLLETTLLLYRPTMDTPIDSMVVNHYIKVDVAAIWLFDPLSGRIYHKKQLK